MDLTLNEIQRRIIGVLIEKQLTTGDYPMTVNALVNGCNQKSNRDPMMDLDEDAVWNTLEMLREKGLISKVLPSGSFRAERFKHEVDTKLQWPKPQKAILCELLLRGPQTLNELRTRALRMFVFDTLEAVSAVLDGLAQQSPPLVAVLPRAPGQSVVRYTHLMYRPGEKPPVAAEPEPRASVQASTGPPPTASRATAATSSDASALSEQLEALQSEVAELHELVATLRRRVEILEGR